MIPQPQVRSLTIKKTRRWCQIVSPVTLPPTLSDLCFKEEIFALERLLSLYLAWDDFIFLAAFSSSSPPSLALLPFPADFPAPVLVALE
mmetsp:Transcript_64176/g.93985  ORF Transcript_64176/g.93985 Transcript_64176/m.93985 type:complete len:89 (+) Transcript_64176:971-1237(+)